MQCNDKSLHHDVFKVCTSNRSFQANLKATCKSKSQAKAEEAKLLGPSICIPSIIILFQYVIHTYSLPKTNMNPKNDGFVRGISFQPWGFVVSIFNVSFRGGVYTDEH